MFPDRRSRSFLDPQAIARLAAVPLCARWPMLGSVSGGIPALTAEPASSSPSIASTSPATICGGSIGGPTADRIVST